MESIARHGNNTSISDTMNPKWPLATLLAIALSGCISGAEDSETPTHSEAVDDPTIGDVETPWSGDGTATIRVRVLHAGGPVNATFIHTTGVLVTFQVLEPSGCGGDPGVASASIGGGSIKYDVVCPAAPAGDLEFEVQVVSGIAAGSFIVHDALPK